MKGPAKKTWSSNKRLYKGWNMVLGKVSLLIVSASFLALLTGCNSLGIGGAGRLGRRRRRLAVTAY
ncbi:hypothetical protein ACCS92_38445, partial [Rhizobium ruizarguesonis]